MAEREYVVNITANGAQIREEFKRVTEDSEKLGQGLKDSLGKGTEGVKTFGDQAAKSSGQALSSFESIALKVTGIVGAFDLASKAMSAIGGAIEGVFAGIGRGSELNDLSQRLGVSVESLSRLELAAKTSGVSLDGLGVGLQQLSKNMVAAASGGEEAQAAFAAVGISAADLKNLNTDQVLGKIAESFSGAEDGAVKTALAMQLLGKAGAQMIPLLNEGTDGLQRFSDLSQKLGLTMTTQLAGAFDSIGDSMDILGSAVTGVQNQFAIGMAPALERVSASVVDFVSSLGIANGGLQDLGAEVGNLIEGAVGPAVESLQKIIETAKLEGLGPALSQALSDAASAAESAAIAIGEKIGAAIESGIMDSAASRASGFATRFLDVIFGGRFDGIKIPVSFDEGSVPFASIEAGWAKQARAIDSASDALTRNAAVSRTASGAYVLLGGDAAVAAEAVKKGTLNYQGHSDAAKKAADSIEKLRERFAEQIRTQTEAVAKMEGQNAAIERIISGNLSAEAATKLLNEATGEAATKAALAAGANQQEATALGQVAVKAAEAASKNRELNATRNAQVQTGYLQQEAALLQQVINGTKTQIEAEHELAVLREEAKGVLADQAELYVTAQENVDALRDRVKDMDDDIVHLGDVFKDSFEQAFDAVIDGTRDFSDVMEGIGLGIGKRLFSAMLESKLKDFDPTVKANFLELGDFGQSIFGKLFSGGSGVSSSGSGSGSGDGLFKQAADWIGGLFKGKSNTGSSNTGSVEPIGQNEDGSYIYSDGSEGYGQSRGDGSSGSGSGSGSKGGFGEAAGNAGAGALIAYSMFQGTDSTRLEGLIARGTASGVLSAANNFAQVVGTVIGAVASIWIGPLGGVVGGVIGSILSSVIVGSVSRKSFLNGGKLDGPVGAAATPQAGLWDGGNTMFLAKALELYLALPTLGLAMRKGAESVLDASDTFKALQSKWGDITVRSGGPEGVYRNNLTGSDTALGRGWTQDQVDLTEGATAAIFGQIARGEVPEDAGRLGEAMGRIMAEFLSRGAADGVDFEPMFDQLRMFAHEAGIDLFTTMRALDDVMAQSIASATTWGKLDPMAAATQGARAYAEAFVGATQVFQGDFPTGVHLASVALQSMEKDGVKLFDSLDKNGHEALLALTDDTALTMDVVQRLIEQGWDINIEEFEAKIQAIAESATYLGRSLGDVLNFDSAAAGVENVFQGLKAQVFDLFKQTSLKQLFEKTDIAAAFEPVFAVLDRIDEFDLTTATGSQEFMGQLLPALAQGKANLEAYIPILQVMADNWKEIQKIIDEAMKPDVFEQAAAVAEGAFNTIASSLGDAIDEGLAVLEDGGTWDDAVKVFNDAFGAGVEKSFKEAIFNAIVQQSLIEPLIASYQPAFQYVVAAGLIYGFSDPRVQAAFAAVLGDVQSKAEELGLLVFKAKVDSEELTTDLERAFNDAADITTGWADDLQGTLEGAFNAAFDVLADGGSREDALAAWNESLGGNTRDAVLRGIVMALIDATIIEPFIKQWAPYIQLWVAAGMENGFDDPRVKNLGDKLFGPDSDFMRGLENLPTIGIDLYGRIIGYEDENGDPIDDGRLDLDGSQTNERPGRRFPGAATGGTFGVGETFIVGEAGPELVQSGPGGISVTPLSAAQANALLDGGLPGYANGRDTNVRDLPPGDGGGREFPRNPDYPGGRDQPRDPIDLNPHSRDDDFRNPTSRPRIRPNPTEHHWNNPENDPDNPGSSGSQSEVKVSFNFTDALDEFFRGGTRKDLRQALAETTGEGILAGMMDAMMKKAGLEAFQKEMATAIETAMEDGTMSASELQGIEDMGKGFKEKLVDMADELGPAFKIIAETFGIDMQDAVDKGIELDPENMWLAAAALGPAVLDSLGDSQKEIGDALVAAMQAAAPKVGEMVSSSLGSMLSDPAKFNFETFSQNLRGQIYQNVAGGLVDAFVQTALIQGALAPMMGAIQIIFDQIGKKQLTVAEANGLIAEQIAMINGVLADPALKAAMDTLLGGIKDIGTNLDAFPPAAESVTDAAIGVQDAVTTAQEDVCDGECALKEQVTNFGNVALDSFGRTGGITDKNYVPAFARGGLVRRPTFGLIGEAGPELIIPLDAIEDAMNSGVDPSVIGALKQARGNFDPATVGGVDDVIGDALQAFFGGSDSSVQSTGSIANALQSVTGSTAQTAADDLAKQDEIIAELKALRETQASGGSSEDIAKGLQELKAAILEERDRPVHTEVKMNDQTLIDAWTIAKRIADKAGIQFGA